jgi:DNA-binding CsgD family transcriptional regulator
MVPDTEDLRSKLIPEQRALLDRLADGATIAAAAAAEFVSLRTANRRIAKARALFGVRTTREAVLAYQRESSPAC